MKNLFAYGTLMCEDIMRDVSGVRQSGLYGGLSNYRQYNVIGEEYPAMVQANGSVVNGLLYVDVPKSAWLRLDRFEGDMYLRQSVEVKITDGKIVTADTYIIRPEYLHKLADSDWNFELFLKRGKRKFISTYRGY